MNSENCETSKPHVLILKLTDKLDLRAGNKGIVYQTLIFIIHGKTLIQLSDGSHSALDIEDCFEYI